MVNKIAPAPGFSRGYRRKRRKSPRWLVDKVEEWIVRLRNAERPEDLGDVKNLTVVFGGRRFRAYGVALSDKDRLLYGVDRATNPPTVILDRVCDHKKVYTHD
jgi:hypothetical protein